MESKPPRDRTESMPLQTRRPVARARPFPPPRDFSSLSIRDLLDARDAYHVHLSSLENVSATAIGRFLIHKEDWYFDDPPTKRRPKEVPRITDARTLANSAVRPWSWPAVLVFVRRWRQPSELGSQVVPRTLYLPDGRVVPTCVVLADPDETPPPPAPGPVNVSSLLGGGYAGLRDHQGERSVGTFACLVRKAGSYFALTNRHVAGGETEEVSAVVRGETLVIGRTSNIAVDRLLMTTVFPEWAGSRTYLTLDAGLVRIEDIRDWTSQVFGIGEIGDLFDATAQTVGLDLIGLPMRAFGATSGVAEGEIFALFFRYQSLGGFDYASDVLIGPRADAKSAGAPPLTRPGDSGALWFYDPPRTSAEPEDPDDLGERELPAERRENARARRLRPVAMQWGGQRVLMPDGSTSTFALASFLSTICRNLDVEVVRNWSLGHDEYWEKPATSPLAGKPAMVCRERWARSCSAIRLGLALMTTASGRVPNSAWDAASTCPLPTFPITPGYFLVETRGCNTSPTSISATSTAARTCSNDVMTTRRISPRRCGKRTSMDLRLPGSVPSRERFHSGYGKSGRRWSPICATGTSFDSSQRPVCSRTTSVTHHSRSTARISTTAGRRCARAMVAGIRSRTRVHSSRSSKKPRGRRYTPFMSNRCSKSTPRRFWPTSIRSCRKRHPPRRISATDIKRRRR